MNTVEIKKLPKSLVELEITVPEKEVVSKMEQASVKLSSGLEIKGFRKGKVPLEVLEKHIGKEKIFEEACFLAANERYAVAIESHGLKVLGHPKMDVLKMAIGNPFVFKVAVPVYPDIQLADYKAIAEKVRGEKKKVEITDDEINKSIDWLRKSRKKEVLVARPAKKGDMVEVDFEAWIGGVKMEGGDSKNHPFVLGESKFIQGFDEEIENMQAKEKKEFALVVPDNFPQANLKGKKIDFKVTLNSVFEVTLPELDDQFAKSIGKFENIQALTDNIRSGLELEKAQAEKERLRQLFAKKAAEESNIEIADFLVDQEVESMIKGVENDVSGHGVKFDDYLLSIKKTTQDLKKDFRGQAELRVKVLLIFPEIAKKENISLKDEEVENRVNELLKKYNNFEQFKENPETLKNYVSGIMMNEKVFEMLEL